jgi:hypothetical protein
VRSEKLSSPPCWTPEIPEAPLHTGPSPPSPFPHATHPRNPPPPHALRRSPPPPPPPPGRARPATPPLDRFLTLGHRRQPRRLHDYDDPSTPRGTCPTSPLARSPRLFAPHCFVPIKGLIFLHGFTRAAGSDPCALRSSSRRTKRCSCRTRSSPPPTPRSQWKVTLSATRFTPLCVRVSV